MPFHKRSFTIKLANVEYAIKEKLLSGKGMWPAIWMLGTNRDKVGWPACGEIDIMENVGFDPDTIHANIHTKAYNHMKGTNKGSKIKGEKPYEQYHVYAIEWHENRIDFFLDDEKYFTFKNEGTGNDVWPYDKPHYLILNAAIGGNYSDFYIHIIDHQCWMKNAWPDKTVTLHRNGKKGENLSGSVLKFPTAPGETVTAVLQGTKPSRKEVL